MKGTKYRYNQKKFAEGMNGDEDLEHKILMKGNSFNFNQKPADHKLFAAGMSGDENLDSEITMKGQRYNYGQRPEMGTC